VRLGQGLQPRQSDKAAGKKKGGDEEKE